MSSPVNTLLKHTSWIDNDEDIKVQFILYLFCGTSHRVILNSATYSHVENFTMIEICGGLFSSTRDQKDVQGSYSSDSGSYKLSTQLS